MHKNNPFVKFHDSNLHESQRSLWLVLLVRLSTGPPLPHLSVASGYILLRFWNIYLIVFRYTYATACQIRASVGKKFPPGTFDSTRLNWWSHPINRNSKCSKQSLEKVFFLNFRFLAWIDFEFLRGWLLEVILLDTTLSIIPSSYSIFTCSERLQFQILTFGSSSVKSGWKRCAPRALARIRAQPYGPHW